MAARLTLYMPNGYDDMFRTDRKIERFDYKLLAHKHLTSLASPKVALSNYDLTKFDNGLVTDYT